MAEQPASTSVIDDATVVDTDVHVSIPAERLTAYLDAPYDRRVTKRDCEPASSAKFWDKSVGGKAGGGERLTDPGVVQRRLVDEFAVDYPLLNTIEHLAPMPDTDLAVELMSAYNDAMLDIFLDDTDFRALALICQTDPHAAAEEIDRIGNEDQFVGVFIYTPTMDPPLGDPRYDPMYRAAADNDLHVAFHGGAASSFRDSFPTHNYNLETFLSVHTLAHLWQSTLTLVSLVVQGVPEKFPELNFTFLEAGVSWVPHMMWRLNKEYSIRRSEAPLLEKSPEAYVRDQFYFGSQPLGEPDDPTMIREMIDLVGAESMTFATDYPHWDFDHPEALDRHLRSVFTEAERERVLHDSAVEAFDLDV
ncbi:MAG: amidohydrolase family protein [Haloferacaceae archaeon]